MSVQFSIKMLINDCMILRSSRLGDIIGTNLNETKWEVRVIASMPRLVMNIYIIVTLWLCVLGTSASICVLFHKM